MNILKEGLVIVFSPKKFQRFFAFACLAATLGCSSPWVNAGKVKGKSGSHKSRRTSAPTPRIDGSGGAIFYNLKNRSETYIYSFLRNDLLPRIEPGHDVHVELPSQVVRTEAKRICRGWALQKQLSQEILVADKDDNGSVKMEIKRNNH